MNLECGFHLCPNYDVIQDRIACAQRQLTCSIPRQTQKATQSWIRYSTGFMSKQAQKTLGQHNLPMAAPVEQPVSRNSEVRRNKICQNHKIVMPTERHHQGNVTLRRSTAQTMVLAVIPTTQSIFRRWHNGNRTSVQHVRSSRREASPAFQFLLQYHGKLPASSNGSPRPVGRRRSSKMRRQPEHTLDRLGDLTKQT